MTDSYLLLLVPAFLLLLCASASFVGCYECRDNLAKARFSLVFDPVLNIVRADFFVDGIFRNNPVILSVTKDGTCTATEATQHGDCRPFFQKDSCSVVPGRMEIIVANPWGGAWGPINCRATAVDGTLYSTATPLRVPEHGWVFAPNPPTVVDYNFALQKQADGTLGVVGSATPLMLLADAELRFGYDPATVNVTIIKTNFFITVDGGTRLTFSIRSNGFDNGTGWTARVAGWTANHSTGQWFVHLENVPFGQWSVSCEAIKADGAVRFAEGKAISDAVTGTMPKSVYEFAFVPKSGKAEPL